MRNLTLVVALGGNAVLREGEAGTVSQQLGHVAETAAQIARVVQAGYRKVLITHGNGPQVGNLLLRSETCAPAIPPSPLDCCVAESQGFLGYMMQQCLAEALRRAGVRRPVATVITQVVVDAADTAFARPTKPVGRFYPKPEADRLAAERGWTMREDAGRGWRRVVPSPLPLEIVEVDVIRRLIESGTVVIAVGGGGVPVVRRPDGGLEGVEAVIDKDFATALAARQIGAHRLAILTGVPRVSVRFGKPDALALDTVGAADLRALAAEGHFPAGSMGPKIQAALDFLRPLPVGTQEGREVVITTPELLHEALEGRAGTRVRA
ncbi:MAG: carbamate kinase [Planctomycetes bacterium]|nr:carbamate kinase [Planctomycetota bacterium]